MPLLRYFIFVGGALLTLLFVVDAFAPPLAVEAAKSQTDLSIIRIHSDQKWPERVVFDTSRPTVPPPQTVVASTMPSAAPQAMPPQTQKSVDVAPLKKGVREAFAQVPSAQDRQRRAEAKRKALARTNPTTIIVAQQPHFGLFGNTW
jgi:hypothetical protein